MNNKEKVLKLLKEMLEIKNPPQEKIGLTDSLDIQLNKQEAKQ